MDLKKWLESVKVWGGAWLKAAADYFASQWGLSPELAVKAALLYLACYAAKINPRITSGFRELEKQKASQKAWDAGNRQGLAVRPATTSLHTVTSLGKPASRAIDIQTSNQKLAADIARIIGLRAGYYFSTPDPVHFDLG